MGKLTLDSPTTQLVPSSCVFHIRILSACLWSIELPIHDLRTDSIFGSPVRVSADWHHGGASVVKNCVHLRTDKEADDLVGLSTRHCRIWGNGPGIRASDGRQRRGESESARGES